MPRISEVAAAVVETRSLPHGRGDLTVREALQAGSAALEPVTSSHRLEAEVLLARAAGVSRTFLLTHPETMLDRDQSAAFLQSIERRANDYPLPYLAGLVEFYGLEFSVSPAVLIPRPETEMLIDLALARRPRSILEMGTGSGCIAITLAALLPEARVCATDISAPALSIARANALKHGVSERVRFVQCDLLSAVRGTVDLIVSNPPYISRQEWDSLPASIRQHEPRVALDGGENGLYLVRRLLLQLRWEYGQFEPAGGGAVLVEIGHAQAEAASALAKSVFPDRQVLVHTDLAGRDRVLEITP